MFFTVFRYLCYQSLKYRILQLTLQERHTIERTIRLAISPHIHVYVESTWEVYCLWVVCVSHLVHNIFVICSVSWISTRFCIYALIKIKFGIVTLQFQQICNSCVPWCQNFVSSEYLENELMDFILVLHMHCYRQDQGWDCYQPISANL